VCVVLCRLSRRLGRRCGRGLLQVLRHELEKGKLGGLGAVLVNEARGQVRVEDGLEVRVRDALEQRGIVELLQQALGEGARKHGFSQALVVPEVAVGHLVGHLEDRVGQRVRQDRARSLGALVLRPQAFKLEARVLLDDLLHVRHVLLVKLGGDAVDDLGGPRHKFNK